MAVFTSKPKLDLELEIEADSQEQADALAISLAEDIFALGATFSVQEKFETLAAADKFIEIVEDDDPDDDEEMG